MICVTLKQKIRTPKIIKNIFLIILSATFLFQPFFPEVKETKASTVYRVPHITDISTSVSDGEFFPTGTGYAEAVTVEAESQIRITRDSIIRDMRVMVDTANASADSIFTLRKNGVDTAMSITIPQGSTDSVIDTSTSVSFSAGDLANYSATMSAGTINIKSIQVTIEDVAGGTVQYIFAMKNDDSLSHTVSSVGRYYRAQGLVTQANGNTVSTRTYAMHDFRVENMGLYTHFNEKIGGTTSGRLNLNGSVGGDIITNLSGAGAGYFDTTASMDVTTGQYFGFEVRTSGTGGTIRVRNWQATLVSDTPGQISLWAGQDQARATGATTYFLSPTGNIQNTNNNTNEALAQYILGADGTLSHLLYDVNIVGVLTADHLLGTRINGVDGNLIVTVPAQSPGQYLDDVNTDVITSTDLIALYDIRTFSETRSLRRQGITMRFTLDGITSTDPEFDQSGYRFFSNTDSTDVGASLSAQNTPATLSSSGENFRLRKLINVSVATLGVSGQNFKLQYVDKGGGTCSSPSGGTPSSYTDVTTGTLIAYNNNATPSDGDPLTNNADDPTNGANNIISQTYEELNNFTNSQNEILSGEDGKWDFSLKDNGADPDITFCFRIVKSDGTALETYSQYPELTTASASGSLSVDILDSGNTPVVTPSLSMSTTDFSFNFQTSTGVFGTSDEKIRVNNGTSTATWTLTLAPDSGPTALWSSGTDFYDFNDPTADAEDGGDADSFGGQMTVDPSVSTITPQGGCTLSNISTGSMSSFNEGVVDSITLAAATSGADTNCTWDITGIGISQTIPAEQPADSYSIDMTLSIIAS